MKATHPSPGPDPLLAPALALGPWPSPGAADHPKADRIARREGRRAGAPGLWAGVSPRRALCACAPHTHRTRTAGALHLCIYVYVHVHVHVHVHCMRTAYASQARRAQVMCATQLFELLVSNTTLADEQAHRRRYYPHAHVHAHAHAHTHAHAHAHAHAHHAHAPLQLARARLLGVRSCMPVRSCKHIYAYTRAHTPGGIGRVAFHARVALEHG